MSSTGPIRSPARRRRDGRPATREFAGERLARDFESLDTPIEVPEYGIVKADIAFGGQFYVQAPASSLGVELGPTHPRDVADPSLGDRLPAPLEIDAVAPFLVWPMFALAGLLLLGTSEGA